MPSGEKITKWLAWFDKCAAGEEGDRSDDYDKLIFKSTPLIVEEIIGVKHNDKIRHRGVYWNIDDCKALKRLGFILCLNTTLSALRIIRLTKQSTTGGLWLCAGLRNNRFLKKLSLKGVCLSTAPIKVLAPFLAHNDSLEKITFDSCGLVSDDIDHISSSLMERSTSSLTEVDLGYNRIEDDNLDILAAAMKNCLSVKRLCLRGNNLKGDSVTSLADLLQSNESNLEELDVSCNLTSKDDALILINSLKTNTKLKTLNLADSYFTDEEYTSVSKCILKLICNDENMSKAGESNNSLSSAGRPFNNNFYSASLDIDGDGKWHVTPDYFGLPFDKYLPEDKNDVIRASLRLNHEEGSNRYKLRHKVTWQFIRGSQLLVRSEDSSFSIGLVPRAIALISHVNISDGESNRNPSWKSFHYAERDPPSRQELDMIRLGAVYHLVRATPELCSESKSDSQKLAEVRSENKRLIEEVERLRVQLSQVCNTDD